jgi:hypothetical protein
MIRIINREMKFFCPLIFESQRSSLHWASCDHHSRDKKSIGFFSFLNLSVFANWIYDLNLNTFTVLASSSITTRNWVYQKYVPIPALNWSVIHGGNEWRRRSQNFNSKCNMGKTIWTAADLIPHLSTLTGLDVVNVWFGNRLSSEMED